MNEKLSLTGWFVGSCTNNTYGMSANLLLAIHGATPSALHGELGLSGDLGGGGPFHGKISGDTFVFSTCLPADQVVIEWRGKVSGEQLSGTYSVTCDHPEAELKVRYQEGVWACALVRSPGIPNPDEINFIWVYDEGRTDGPFTTEEFTGYLNAKRWPLKAFVAMEDQTSWSTIADCAEWLKAQNASGN